MISHPLLPGRQDEVERGASEREKVGEEVRFALSMGGEARAKAAEAINITNIGRQDAEAWKQEMENLVEDALRLKDEAVQVCF